MKYELWYKMDVNVSRIHRAPGDTIFPEQCAFNREILSEPPDNQSKNGYHLVYSESDHPKQSEQEGRIQDLISPRTLPELNTALWCLGNVPLGKVAGRLLVENNVDWDRCQSLVQRLSSLAQASCKLHLELSNILNGVPHQADEAIGGKK